ncbi:MAG: hypothetical protein JWN61_2069 [Pseudonocardiales bacterium]|nr:hypothetical protein [Pseudonocardiales bacterium]
MTQPESADRFVDPELDGTNAAIARQMEEAAKASRPASATGLEAEPADE